MRVFLSIVLCIAFTSHVSVLHSQNWNMVYSLELEAEELIVDLQFEKAAEKYIAAKKLLPESHNLTFKIGFCYLYSDMSKHKSVEYLQEAAKYVSLDYDPRSIRETQAPVEALYYLGRAYHILYQFDNAIQAYNSYMATVPADQALPLVKQQLEAAKRATQLIEQGNMVVEINLGTTINDATSNFNPVISGDGQTLAYTKTTRSGFDVYVARRGTHAWERPRRITNDLRGRFFITSSLSFDGKILYLTEDVGRGSNIYEAFYESGRWSKALRHRGPVNSRHNETHAVESADGTTLYFTSDRPGGYGALDIYKATLDRKGRWSNAENLGPVINTPFNENTPFVTPENILFFSSEGHTGMGGYDVFRVNLDAPTVVENLGYPISTPDDDLFFQPEPGGRSGYLSLNRPNNTGSMDIHHVRILPMVDLLGLVTSMDPSVVPSNSFDIVIRNAETQETITELSAPLAQRKQLHRLPPGHYTATFSSTEFEPFETSFSIPEDYQDPSFLLQAHLAPLSKPAPEQLLLADVEQQPEIVEPLPEVIEPPMGVAIQEPVELPQQVEVRQVAETPARPRKAPDSDTDPSFKAKLPFEGGGNIYTVQIMALQRMAPISQFMDVDNLVVVSSDDGYVRYSSGLVESLAEANAIKAKLHELGYTDAFIRPIPLGGSFTIQIMALRVPREFPGVASIQNLIVRKGEDCIFRYSVGTFTSYSQAKENLPSMVSLGYSDAFVSRVGQ